MFLLTAGALVGGGSGVPRAPAGGNSLRQPPPGPAQGMWSPEMGTPLVPGSVRECQGCSQTLDLTVAVRALRDRRLLVPEGSDSCWECGHEGHREMGPPACSCSPQCLGGLVLGLCRLGWGVSAIAGVLLDPSPEPEAPRRAGPGSPQTPTGLPEIIPWTGAWGWVHFLLNGVLGRCPSLWPQFPHPTCCEASHPEGIPGGGGLSL